MFVPGFSGGEDDDAMGAVGGNFCDFGSDVFGCGEVDEFLERY